MDKKAVSISRHAIKNKFHEILKLDQKFFIFLPFMHSEEMKDQIYCENLINKFLLNHSNYKDIIKFSKIHKEIIKKFGRFPYRNKVLNRKNTKDEEEYLNSNHYDFFNV